jgi:hypothetical protein
MEALEATDQHLRDAAYERGHSEGYAKGSAEGHKQGFLAGYRLRREEATAAAVAHLYPIARRSFEQE